MSEITITVREALKKTLSLPNANTKWHKKMGFLLKASLTEIPPVNEIAINSDSDLLKSPQGVQRHRFRYLNATSWPSRTKYSIQAQGQNDNPTSLCVCVRACMSGLYIYEKDELLQYHYKNHLFGDYTLFPEHQCFVSLLDTYQQVLLIWVFGDYTLFPGHQCFVSLSDTLQQVLLI